MSQFKKRVLVACEVSGVVRRAFAELGYDAWSCDLNPSEDRSDRHYTCDVREVLHYGWGLIIAHPPCTRLANSGGRWLTSPPPSKTSEQIWAEFEAAVSLYWHIWSADCPRIAIENPIFNGPATARFEQLPRRQLVQPWHFGDPVIKQTGFHLKGLPYLQRTSTLRPPKRGTDAYKAWTEGVRNVREHKNRSTERSRTYIGMARAMASQWGPLISRNAHSR